MFAVEIWGTVANWVAALGTGGGVTAAAVYYILDARRSHKKQAQLITPWMVWGGDRLTVHVVNFSTEPVFYPKLEIMSVSSRRAMWVAEHVWNIQGPEDPSAFKYYWAKNLYEVGQAIDLAPERRVEIVQPLPYSKDYYEVTLFFRDAQGRDWNRDVDTSKFKGIRYQTRSGRRSAFRIVVRKDAAD